MPFGKRKIEKPVERRIEVAAPSKPSNRAEPPTEDVQEVRQFGTDLRNKADELLGQMRQANRADRIPVDQSLTQVVGAARRLDPESDGKYVTYDLYLSLIEGRFQQYQGVDIDGMLNSLSGITMSDASRFAASLKGIQSEEPGEDPAREFIVSLLDLALQLGTIKTAQELNGLFDADDKQASTLTPNTGAAAAQIAIAYGVLFGIRGAHGLLSDAIHGRPVGDGIKDEWRQTWRDLGVEPELMSRIENTLFNTSVPPETTDQPALVAVTGDQDPELILNYVQEAVNNSDSIEDDYSHWRRSPEVMSAKYNAALYETDVGRNVLPPEGDEFAQRAINTLNLLDVGMHADLVASAFCDTGRLNHLLNAYATLMESQYTNDIICCLIRFLGSVGEKDIATLRRIRDLLVVGLRIANFDVATMIRPLQSALDDYFRRKVLLALIQALDRVLRIVSDPILNWLAEEDEKWLILFRCTGVLDLANFVLAMIEKIQSRLVELLIEWYDGIEIHKVADSSYLAKDLETSWTRNLIRLLDASIRALENGNLCAEDDSFPTVDQANRVLQSLDLYNDVSFTRDGSPYRRFDRVDIVTDTGFHIPQPSDESDPNNPKNAEVEDCMKRLSGAVVPELKRSADEIQAELADIQREYGVTFDE